jgi:2-polyprenyl-3-methyl-5-hydroxy-6-metoxy-1,4-benzoquinol methylase
MSDRSQSAVVITKPPLVVLRENSIRRHGANGAVGPAITARRAYEYFTPEEYYECVLDSLVLEQTRWLDVGCGRDLLPNNHTLAGILARRCGRLVGIDPDANVHENAYVHERHRAALEEFRAEEPFDVISMRMVVEHIERPQACVQAIKNLSHVGTAVVIYTPHRRSLLSLAAAAIPDRAHHRLKRAIWKTHERDTFPTHYRMNTQSALKKIFGESGFREAAYWPLDDATVLVRHRWWRDVELSAWSAFRRLGMPYPEQNIVAVYVREP